MIGAGVPLTLLYNSNRFGLPLLEVKLMTLPIVNLLYVLSRVTKCDK